MKVFKPMMIMAVLAVGVVDCLYLISGNGSGVTEAATKNKSKAKKSTELSSSLNNYYSTLETTINDLTENLSGDIAVTYLDLATGEMVSVNGSEDFVAASTTKVPLVMLISEKVASGELSWDQEVTYSEDDYESGTGTIQNNIQASYTVEELTTLAITVSDNIAKNMLYGLLGGYEAGVKEWYEEYLEVADDDGENEISSDDMAQILQILYENEENLSGYTKLIKNMQNTIFSERLETSTTSGSVAHKIGTNETYIHDVGIFSGEHPYVLTVYSNQVSDAEALISELSDAVWAQNQSYPS